MLSLEKFFGNPFDSSSITPLRLLIFAKDVLVNMTAANSTHTYDAQIAIMNQAITNLETEVGNLDSAENLRSGQTDEVDAVAALFVRTMSAQEGVIADKFGSKDTIGFKEFYPLLMGEYNAANRTSLPILAKRVSTAAIKYATELGAPLSTKLQTFLTDYTAARKTQSASIGIVGSTRNARTVSVSKMEVALTCAVHFVGTQYPTDVVSCSKFFNFNLLFSSGNHKHINHIGTLVISEIKEIANQLFTDNWIIIIRNKGKNAAFEAWLSETSLETTALKSIIVQPDKTLVLKPSDLGNLANPFLLVKNLSAVNPANYEIVIIG